MNRPRTLPRIRELCERREVAAVAALLALALTAPALGLGLVGDDYPHRTFLLEQLRLGQAHAAPWAMFGRPTRDPVDTLTLVHVGFFPWWTSPSFSIAFLRPLSAVTHLADYALWPSHPALMHLQNMIWYALLVLVAGALYRRLLGAGTAAAIAAFAYAVDEAHIGGAAWIAGRNTVLSALFSVAAVLLFDRARRAASRGALALSACAFVLALASGEGGVAAFAYLGAHALWLDRAPWRTRIAWLAPHAALLALYFVAYRLLGYGAYGSGIYLDPFTAPGRFAWTVLQRLPALLREQFALPGLAYHLAPEGARSLLDALGLALLALCAWPLVLLLRRSATSRFFATGLLLSALPICAIGGAPRLLFMVGIGGAGLIAELIATGIEALPRASVARARASAIAAAAALFAVHLVIAPASAPLTTRLLSSYDAVIRAAERALPDSPTLGDKALLLLNAPDYFRTTFSLRYRVGNGGPLPLVAHILYAGGAPVQLFRPAPDTVTLAPHGGFLHEGSSWLVRKPEERFEIGQVVWLSHLAVTVEELTSDGRPARVRLTLPNPDDPQLLWMAWSDRTGRFERVTPPPLGQSLALPGAVPMQREAQIIAF